MRSLASVCLAPLLATLTGCGEGKTQARKRAKEQEASRVAAELGASLTRALKAERDLRQGHDGADEARAAYDDVSRAWNALQLLRESIGEQAYQESTRQALQVVRDAGLAFEARELEPIERALPNRLKRSGAQINEATKAGDGARFQRKGWEHGRDMAD